MFRDQKQQNLACRTIAWLADEKDLWSEHSGPTARLLLILDGKDDFYLSSGQELMLKIAVDFWNGRGHAHLCHMLAVLDNVNLTAVAQLMLALAKSSTDGGSSIDAWIVAYGQTGLGADPLGLAK